MEQKPDSPKLEDYEFLRITDKTAIPYPIPILKINGDRVATPGAIVTISGQPKSGKSALTGIIIAGAISPNGNIDGLPLVEVLPNEDGKAVIHGDTEQDRYTHQFNHKTILKRAGFVCCPDYFLSYNIRRLNLIQYQPFLNSVCEAADTQFKGIHSIFIDGGADFIKSVNDEAAAYDIVDYFDKLAQKYNTAIFVIVHTNPGSEKERGHFGSQCQRKSTGVLSVKKENDISYLDPKMMRFSGETTRIQFKYDPEKKYHVHCEVDSPTDRKAAEKINKLQTICTKVFSGQRSYSWGDAIQAIIRETATGRNTAINTFKEMKAFEMVKQGDDNNWRGLEV